VLSTGVFKITLKRFAIDLINCNLTDRYFSVIYYCTLYLTTYTKHDSIGMENGPYTYMEKK